MRTQRLLLAALVLAPFALAFEPRGDKLAFHPDADLSVTKTFTNKTQLQLDDMKVTMNGQPAPMGDIEMEMNIDMVQTVAVADTYVSVGEGRPNKLRRSFDKLGSTGSFSMKMPMMPDGGQEKSINAESDLEGKRVLFTWNADDKSFKPTFEESEGDAKLLEGLEEDMDLRVLLPGKEVAEGDTWDLDIASLKSILAPGGNLAIKPKDEEAKGGDMMGGMDGMSDISSMLGDLEGEASAEYKGSREVDGVKVGVIFVKMKLKSSNDMTSTVEKQMEHLPEGSPDIKVDHVDVELEMTVEGTLHWDLAAGIAHSFELSGTIGTTMDMAMALDMGEKSMDIEQSFEMSGSMNSTLAVTKN